MKTGFFYWCIRGKNGFGKGEGRIKEILWDYREPPEDLLRRLQRLADFFPRYGQDRETVALLYRYRDQLKLDTSTRALIEACQEAWIAHRVTGP